MLGLFCLTFTLCLCVLMVAGTAYVVGKALDHLLMVTLPIVVDTYGRWKYPDEFDK